jgi:hypothetical protein
MNQTSQLRTRAVRRGALQKVFGGTRLAVTSLFVAAILAVPGAARASAVRTVCASGCTFTSLQTAVNNSNPDDFIEVMPGTYPEPVDVTVRLHIFAPADEPRPVVTSGQAGATVRIEPAAAGTTITHLDIRGTGTGSSALEANGAITASDVALTATSECAILNGSQPSQLGPGVTAATAPGDPEDCVEAGDKVADSVTGVTVNAPDGIGVQLLNGATLTDSTVNAHWAVSISEGTVRRATLHGTDFGVTFRSTNPSNPPLVSDSVVTSTADDGDAVIAFDAMFDVPVTLRNVTAIATGRGSNGLLAFPQANPGSAGGAIDARNVIARGTAHDVWAAPGESSCGCSPGRVVIGHSNFRDAAGVLDTSIGHNQSADPLLVNPVAGAGQDFHIASANSPVIGAGTPDPSDSSSDRDGIAHPNPPAIGAYEYTGPPAAPSGALPPGSGGSGATAGPGGGSITTGLRGVSRKPTISQLGETRRVFVVASASTPLYGRTSAASFKRGTTFLFELDQPATVAIVITTSAKCRRTTPRTARDPRCVRTVARLTRSAHAGFNKVAFSGRIRGKPLKPGDYRAVFAAASAGGSSAPEALRFRIVGR